MNAAPPRQVFAETSNRATRAASLGLAAVVVCFAMFSIISAYTTRTQVDRAQRSASLIETYQSAIAVFRTEETFALKYLLDPRPEKAARLEDAGADLAEAVSEITAQGGQEDAKLARELLALHDRYLVASERLLGAMGAGDQVEARRIDDTESHPVFLEMQYLLTSAADERLADNQAALAELAVTARWTLILAPVVFAIGFVLLIVLWRILERYHRATSETYREIEQLSRLRGEFVSIVSHEFRTPLTGVVGFSEMMRDEDLTVPEMKEYAGDINKDARRLTNLINDMLDLDVMESGRLKMQLAPVDLNRIAADAATQFRSSAADHPIALRLAEGLPMLEGESDRLTQVVANLLSNAIKYSPNGGAIELRTQSEGSLVTLTVRDHGIGIPAEQLESIFDRYSRVEETTTANVKGVGLGLAIVSHLVRLHRGKVWATSEAGEGSVFHVQLHARPA